MSQLEFNKMFQNEQDCYFYLESLKWRKGFVCSKCRSNEYRRGNKAFDRRCTSFGKHHSLTSQSLFHNVKFSILNVFHIAFRLSSKKGISTCEIAKTYGINQKTAWLFKRKFQEAIKYQVKKTSLETHVEIDEFFVGGKREKKRGRSMDGKKGALIMLEKLDSGNVGNINMTQIKSFSKDELTSKIDEHISKTAKLTTDKYSTYESMKKTRENMETIYSNSGKNFKELHQTIANFKGWLRGIHHKVSEFHFESYLIEFVFRHNHRNYEIGIFNSIIYGFNFGNIATRSTLSNNCN